MANKVKEMRFWVHKILPLVYDDALSYYEVLCKVVAKLNEVIESTNDWDDRITEAEETVGGFDGRMTELENRIVEVIGSIPDVTKADSFAEGSQAGFILAVGEGGKVEWVQPEGSDVPENRLVPTSGTTGQVLTKTPTGSKWADATGGDVPENRLVPTTGTAGQILSKTPTGSEWVDPEGADVPDNRLIPQGGTAGQVLAKRGDDDYDTEWKDVEGGTTENNTFFGTCSTAGDESVKNVVCDDFVLRKGNVIIFQNYYDDTKGTIQLNVNGTGAKDVLFPTGSAVVTFHAQDFITAVYDGMKYVVLDSKGEDHYLGVPNGGSTGQVLMKTGARGFAYAWSDVPTPEGGIDVITKENVEIANNGNIVSNIAKPTKPCLITLGISSNKASAIYPNNLSLRWTSGTTNIYTVKTGVLYEVASLSISPISSITLYYDGEYLKLISVIGTKQDQFSGSTKNTIKELPYGGSQGQVLAKKSGVAYDVEWVDAGGGGGGIELLDIEVASEPIITTYYSKEQNINYTGVSVKAYYTGGIEADVTDLVTFDPADGSNFGTAYDNNKTNVNVSLTVGGITKTQYGAFRLGYSPESAPLPDGMFEMEWLESTGYQGFDTGVVPAEDVALWTEIYPTNTGVYQCVFGANSTSSGESSGGFGITIGGNTAEAWVGNQKVTFETIIEQGMKYKVFFNTGWSGYTRKIVRIGSEYKELPAVPSGFTNQTIHLFSGNFGGGGTSYAHVRMTPVWIYKGGLGNDNIVRYYVPVADVKNGRVGMYDKINGEFKGSYAEEDIFVVGKIKDSEVQEYITQLYNVVKTGNVEVKFTNYTSQSDITQISCDCKPLTNGQNLLPYNIFIGTQYANYDKHTLAYNKDGQFSTGYGTIKTNYSGGFTNKRCIVDFRNTSGTSYKLSVNGTGWSGSPAGNTSHSTEYSFFDRQSGQSGANMELGHVIIKSGTNTDLFAIPCVQKTDNKIGYFDLHQYWVDKQKFVYGATIGSLTAGGTM